MKWLDSKFTQRIFTELPWFKVSLMALLSLLLIVSLFWVWQAFSTPKVTEEPITLVNYEHQGEFDYEVYLKPSHLFGPPPPEAPQQEEKLLYFTNIIKDIEVEFSYGFDPDSPVTEVVSDVDIVAIITGPSQWQKEVLLKSDSAQDAYFTIEFPLELDEFDKIINTIEKELGIRPPTPKYEYVYEYKDGELVEVRRRYVKLNVYDLVIEARVYVKAYTGTAWIEDSFVQPMELNVGRGTLEWDNELVLYDKKFHEGFSYEHQGNFNYTIELKENSLYSTEIKTLSPEPYEPLWTVHRPPGEVYFTKIVDIMRGNFSYQFVCDRPVTNLVEEIELTAILEYPDMWSKTFTLVPTSQKSGDFTVDFIVDVNYLNELANTIGQETGVGVASLNLTIKAVVQTTADTDYGHIDEKFTHTLDGELEKSTLTWKDELDKEQPGTIETITTVTNPNVVAYRILSSVALVLILLGFLFVGWNASQARPIMSKIEKEALRAKKKYKNVVVDVEEMPVAKAEETVITCGSVDELVKAADALLKPVLHQAEADKHTYCAIDGLTRYEYVSYLQPQDASSVPVPEEGNG